MAREIIGIGTTANDGTGDPLRTAFDKSNSNFEELYDTRQPLISIPRVAARWYWPDDLANLGGVTNGGGMSINMIYYVFFRVFRPITISDLGTRITTAQASANIKLAVYGVDATTGLPSGLPLAETENISAAATGNVSADIIGANVTLAAGAYYAAFWSSIANVAIQASGFATIPAASAQVGASTQAELTSGGGTVPLVFRSTETYGDWPNATSETILRDNTLIGLLQLRAA